MLGTSNESVPEMAIDQGWNREVPEWYPMVPYGTLLCIENRALLIPFVHDEPIKHGDVNAHASLPELL